MGTVVSFAVVPDGRSAQAAADAAAAAGAIDAACAALHRADATFSTWDPQSPVSRLRRGAAALRNLPAEVAEVLDLCQDARKASGGWFDPWAISGGVDPAGLVKGWGGGGGRGALGGGGG